MKPESHSGVSPWLFLKPIQSFDRKSTVTKSLVGTTDHEYHDIDVCNVFDVLSV